MRWHTDLAAPLLLGLVHALSFAPLALWWLQLLSFAGLCLLILLCPHRAGRSAWLFGVATFCAGLSWMFISMHRFGAMPAPIAALAVLLLSSYLAIFGAIAARLAVRLATPAGRATPLAGALPYTLGGCWLLAEIARGLILTGFPWLSVGYAHIDGPFAALAPLFGVYGLAGVSVVASMWLARGVQLWCDGASPGRQRLRAAVPALAAVVVLPGLCAALGQVSFSSAAGESIAVRLLQGNVEQQLKFNPQRTLRAMQEYANLIEQTPAQLYVLPETAWTVGLTRTPARILDTITDHLKAHGGVMATGMPVRQASTGTAVRTVLTNSVVSIDGNSQIVSRYDKRHLVPFGEFVPPGFRWFVDMMQVPLGDFGRGRPGQQQLVIADSQIAFNICYEDLFGEELALQVRHGANILINVSNIAWFGQSHALPQHLNISRMRALELARPMLRATNTGVTAHIDADGTVVSRLPDYHHGALDVRVQPMTGLTPYARFALWLPAVLAFALLLAGPVIRWRAARH